MDRCALFVDAGYLLADGAMAVHGTRNREFASWDYAGVIEFLGNVARDRTGLPLLRCYWYEATLEGRRTPEHDTLADLPGVKLRLGRMRPGRREGVESEIHRDLATLARNGAVSDALVVSAEEDLAQVIADVQDLGVRVVIVHITVDGNWTIARTLRQECDDIVEIGEAHLRPYVDRVVGADLAGDSERQAVGAYAGRALTNGHGPVGTLAHQSLPSGSHHAPPAIYTAPVIAEYQRAAQPPPSAPSGPAPAGTPSGSPAASGPANHSGSAAQPGAGAPPSGPAGAAGGTPPGQHSTSASSRAGQPAAGGEAGEHAAQPDALGAQVSAAMQPGMPPGAGLGQQSPPGMAPEASSGEREPQMAGRPGGQQTAAPAGPSPGMPDSHGLPSRPPAPQRPSGEYGLSGGQGQAGDQRPQHAQQSPHGMHSQQAMTSQAGMPGPNTPGVQAPQASQPQGPPPQSPQALGPHPQSTQQSPGTPPGPQFQGPPLPAPQFHGGQAQEAQPQGMRPPQGMPSGQPVYPPAPGYRGAGQEPPGMQAPPGRQGVPPGQAPPAGPPAGQGPAGPVPQPQPQQQSTTAPRPYPPPGPGGGFTGVPPGHPYQSTPPGQQGARMPGPPYVPQQAPYGGPQPAPPRAAAPPPAVSLADAVQAAHGEGFNFGQTVARDAPALWLEAVLARKPRMPSDLEARLLQDSSLPIDSLLHDEVRHALRRGFWDALERSRH